MGSTFEADLRDVRVLLPEANVLRLFELSKA